MLRGRSFVQDLYGVHRNGLTTYSCTTPNHADYYKLVQMMLNKTLYAHLNEYEFILKGCAIGPILDGLDDSQGWKILFEVLT